MIKNFRHRGLQRLFERGDRSKIRPDLIARAFPEKAESGIPMAARI
jgi:hypothetical protein